MAKGAAFCNDLLKLILQGTAIANVADNAATSPLTSVFVALHTADPSAGTQTTNEVAYTGYARVAVARTTGGWTITTNSVVPAAQISFPACTGGTATATNWSVGTLTTAGSGRVIWTGTISPTISIANGITPILSVASTITES